MTMSFSMTLKGDFTKFAKKIRFVKEKSLRVGLDLISAEIAEETINYIKSKKRRLPDPNKKEENTIEGNIKVHKMYGAKTIGWGIGAIALLDNFAPHWAAINFGFLPPPTRGFFNGSDSPSPGMIGTDYFSFDMNGYKMIPKKAYPGMHYWEYMKKISHMKIKRLRSNFKKGL